MQQQQVQQQQVQQQQVQQQFVPTTRVEDDTSNTQLPPPPPLIAQEASTSPMEAWSNVFGALKSSGNKKINVKQLAQCGHVEALSKVYESLNEKYKNCLEKIRQSLDDAE